MKATGWGLCAMAVLTAGLAGCPGADMFTQKHPPQIGQVEDHFVDGKLEVVTDRTQGMLRQLGIEAVATPEGEGLRLQCTTPRDKHFTVVLTRSPVNNAFTNLRVQWQDEEETDVTQQLLNGLNQAGLKVLI